MDINKVLNIVFKASFYTLGALLLLLVVLTAIVGASETILKVVGWFIVASLLISLTSFVAIRIRKP